MKKSRNTVYRNCLRCQKRFRAVHSVKNRVCPKCNKLNASLPAAILRRPSVRIDG